GFKSNAYLIFDYQSPTDFKFAGIDVSLNKMVMGHRDASGWIVDVQTPGQFKPGQIYNMLLQVNGSSATLVVNKTNVFRYTVPTGTAIYGVRHFLKDGFVGIGADNAVATIDNVVVQVIPASATFRETETFDDGVADRVVKTDSTGTWTVSGGKDTGSATGIAM